MIQLINDDVKLWSEKYEGPQFHALLADPPYHLLSTVRRFGKNGSAPAKYGTDGVFQRTSRGFMGQEWDGGNVAFDPETWARFMPLLYPGAFGMAFAAARGWHRLAVAIEDAGFIIHPTIFGWVQSQGFPHATRIDKYLGEAWQGHRYGAGAMKPAIEPIILFQAPYNGRPLDNIAQTGAGALNIDGCRIKADEPYKINTWDDGSKPFGGGAGHEFTGRDEAARWPANFFLDETTAKKMPDVKEYFYIVQDQIDNADPVFYCPKVMPGERYAGNIQNNHATLKPLSLCKYLATLLLPPLLYAPRRLFVPFAGAGSEMIGAYQAGWEDITGIEKMAEYCEIGMQRIAYYMGETLPLFQTLAKQTA